jgi:cullin-associated NEDD8-dissociated protein 1
VAESIGRLYHAYPEELEGSILEGLYNGSEKVKETLAKSVKYSMNKEIEESNKMGIEAVTLDLIKLSKETSPNVKRNALEALTTIIHFGY